MDYKQQYMDIFTYTRVLIGDDIEKDVEFIEKGREAGHQFSIGFLALVAEHLTAYNEMYPYPEFIPVRFFRKA